MKITKREIELVCDIANTLDREHHTNFTGEDAIKLYELLKILLHPETKNFVCLNCQKGFKIDDSK